MASVIFNGDYVKALKNRLKLGEDAFVIAGESADPTTTAFDAPAGSIYIRTNGVIYKKNDAGSTTNWEEIGSGESGKNYIETRNAKFEQATNDWAAYDDASDYVDGTGGSPSLTVGLTTTASEILEGSQSFEIIKPASDTEFQGVSVATLPIDRGDRGEVLFIKMTVDFSAATGEDWEVRAYDITNSAILYTGPVDGRGILNRKIKISVPLYTESTTEDVRLSIHCKDSNTDAYSCFVDEVEISPIVSVPFFAGIDRVILPRQVPTGTLAGAYNTAIFGTKDIDDSGAYDATTGVYTAPASGVVAVSGMFRISHDSGQPFSAMRIVNTTTGEYIFDHRTPSLATSIARLDCGGELEVTKGDTLEVQSYTLGTTPAYTNDANFGTNSASFILTPDSQASGVLSTAENLISTIKVFAEGNALETITANTEDVNFAETSDPQNLWDGQVFTAPKKGRYRLSGRMLVSTTPNITAYGYVNGVLNRQIGRFFTQDQTDLNGTFDLDKGDTLSVRTNGTVTLGNSAPSHWLAIDNAPDLTVFGLYGKTELIESSATGTAYTITALTWGDLTSIVLPAGEWDIEGTATYLNNGSVSNHNLGISENAGTSAVGLVFGDTYNSIGLAINFSGSLNVISNGVVVTSSTTYYLKAFVDAYSGSPLVAYKISARRIK